MRITAIERQRRRSRASVLLDGRFALALPLDVAADAGLRPGDEINEQRLRALRESAAAADAMGAALRLLSYRPRSEAELRQRLHRRGAPPGLIESTLGRLRELGLADDAAFARAWVDSRQRSSPRGRRLLRQELRARGLEPESSRALLESVDDEDAALRAAVRRAASLRGLPYEEFHHRLGGFLRRRGFDFATVRDAVARCWREAGGAGRRQ